MTARNHVGMRTLTPAQILSLFRQHGDLAYADEGVTQAQHGWQCAQLALRAGATPALQLAAWLHDLGHLMTGLTGSPTTQGINDRHEAIAADALAPLFGPDVAEPVALHVLAKRHLVTTRPSYLASLSPDSVRSLALQGGPMQHEEARAFSAHPRAWDALRLRAWDDVGKDPHWQARSDEEALQALSTLMDQALNAQRS